MSEPSEPLGTLLIRLWRASADPDAPLMARFVGLVDTLAGDTDQHEYAAGVDEILAVTRRWLERYEQTTAGD